MERAIPILPADDLGAAKAFSVEGLGFSVFADAPAPLTASRIAEAGR